MAAQSSLAMLVLVTPYTILYLFNQLFLQGVLDNVHYVFFELIFVLAFQKVFGINDLSERFFPAQVAVHSTQAITPVKTTAVNGGEGGAPKKRIVKKIVRKNSPTTTTTTSSIPSGPVVKKPKVSPYANQVAAMEKKLTDYIENTEIWEKIYEEDVRGKIEVYQYKARPMCYKVIAVMNNTPETTFDLLCDITRRTEWDPLCVETKTVADVGPGLKILYVRTKAMWPTSSRDTLILGSIKKLDDGRYMNVTSSVEHHLMPERTKESIVRMDTAIAGQIIGPEPGQPDKARLVQVLDTDLKGWIPDKLIQLVSTKAVPGGIRKVNKILRSTDSYTVSKTMETYEKGLKAAEEAAEQGGGDAEIEEDNSNEKAHEISSLKASIAIGSSANGHDFGHKAVERKQQSTFDALWQGLKQSFGYGHNSSAAKTNKALVGVIVIAVLGPVFARFRRRRR
ncbi:StAR- lipid transfer protein 5 [Entomortierella beljakovae]|nr:StAR- lipid transfer protein 5 [Entomortierella beljakovae]